MSAICGIVHFDGKPVSRSDLELMARSSERYGSEGVAYWVQGCAGFAYLPFHVTPESVRETQPLVSNDGQLVLCADARLDNRDEILGQLTLERGEGHSASDAEIILAAYRRWGSATPEKLLGDFAFSVFDLAARSIFIARDTMGGRTVHYHYDRQRLVFGTAVSALLDLPGFDTSLNSDAVLKAVSYISPDHDETYFKTVACLAPAHTLLADGRHLSCRRYWDYQPQSALRFANPIDYAEHLLELINRCVKARTRTIGAVGISLSGGHDSSLLAAVAARAPSQTSGIGSTLKSYSYVFDRYAECDERAFIRPTVEMYGLEAHYLAADAALPFGEGFDQPLPRDTLWLNCYGQLPDLVRQAAWRDGCRVLLNGHLGDALFGGANLHIADLTSEKRWFELLGYLTHHRHELNWRRDFLDGGLRPVAPKALKRLYRRVRSSSGSDQPSWLAPERARRLLVLCEQRRPEHSPSGLLPGQRSRYTAIFDASWAQGLAVERGCGFGRYQVEPASPYYDRQVAEFVLRLPENRIRSAGSGRRLQVDAMRHVLPKSVCDRSRKTDFLPLLREGLFAAHDRIRDLFGDESVSVSSGWLAPGWVERQLTLLRKQQADYGGLANVIFLEHWLRACDQSSKGLREWSAPYRLSDRPG